MILFILPIHVPSALSIVILLFDSLNCGNSIAEYDMLIPT